MKRSVLALLTTFALAAPLSAQTMDILLPNLSFPDETVTPSTKGCDANLMVVCQPQE